MRMQVLLGIQMCQSNDAATGDGLRRAFGTG